MTPLQVAIKCLSDAISQFAIRVSQSAMRFGVSCRGVRVRWSLRTMITVVDYPRLTSDRRQIQEVGRVVRSRDQVRRSFRAPERPVRWTRNDMRLRQPSQAALDIGLQPP